MSDWVYCGATDRRPKRAGTMERALVSAAHETVYINVQSTPSGALTRTFGPETA